jgi:hypothetical protein
MPIGISPIFSTVVLLILYIGIPLGVVYIIFRVIRAGRELASAQQAETQRMVKEVIELLKENNRLLSEMRASR